MLIVVEAKMIKNTIEAEKLIVSNPKVSMDIDNGNVGDQEKIFLCNQKGSPKVKPFDYMVKRNVDSKIILNVDPHESIFFYY